MAGQLVSLLLLGLLVSHIFFYFSSGKTDGTIHKLSLNQTEDQLSTARQLLITCSNSCNQSALLGALEGDFATFSLVTRPKLTTMSEEESAVAKELTLKINAWAHIHFNEADSRIAHGKTRTVSINALMPLPDGKVLHGKIWPVVRNAWWRSFITGIITSVIPVLLLVLVFARYLLRPLRALAQAAEQISRGEIVILPARGPQEIREVATAFNVMQAKLARLVADRTQTLAAISHDLRTPITSLRLRVELIDDIALRIAMTRTLDDMRQMVDETLVFTRDDSRNENTEFIDLGKLVDKICEEQRRLGGDVQSTKMPSLPLRGRPLALKRALGNLIENSLRYGGPVEVSLIVGGDVEIRIEDRGPGLPQEWLEKVFEPFVRPSHDRCHNTGGVGLGLTIARSAIEAHGGQITLTNREGGGLRASVCLPFQPC